MIAAITMVKDEADIIRYTIEHMLTQVDRVYVMDNLSTDGTADILLDMQCSGMSVCSQLDRDIGYRQSDKMTRLAHRAGSEGATWIVPFDADEGWLLPSGLEHLDADVLNVTQHIFVPCEGEAHDEPNPLLRMQHRLPSLDRHFKVAFRYRPGIWIEQGNHDVHGMGAHRRKQLGHLRHFMYRSLEQAQRKVNNGVRAYNAAQVSSEYGVHWFDLYGKSPTEWEQWWTEYTNQPLVFDPWPA